jgi:hypothetical protein
VVITFVDRARRCAPGGEARHASPSRMADLEPCAAEQLCDTSRVSRNRTFLSSDLDPAHLYRV